MNVTKIVMDATVASIQAELINVSTPGHPASVTGQIFVTLGVGQSSFTVAWYGDQPAVGERYRITVEPA